MRNIYKLIISPFIHFLSGPTFGCRFQPTCSDYFFDSIDQFGIVFGIKKGVLRLLRCHPWGGRGFDPVCGETLLVVKKEI